ncbi:hypothetical protein ABZ876_16435 [Streptomyces sp. NPDC046931]|uniref:hypothetical protein n=1 Tax=Streptomyces sp. NPDC046931 TaxID=3154806 RepID=UPI0033DF55E7
MTTHWRASPGPPGTAADRQAARQTRQLLAGELARARAAALAWRNGLAALFVGLLSFGLIKGRTDIGKLASPYDALVGVALLLCLLFGASGALLLLRAAHGAPTTVRLPTGVPAVSAALHIGDHMETRRSVRALGRGVVLTIACGAMLVAGVALTWYGPEKEGPRLLVRTSWGEVCGKAERTEAGRLVLRTDHGEVGVPLTDVRLVDAVDDCSGAASG